jgi:hypothetical protein
VHHTDFFRWAKEAEQRFDCIAGNPPFIRYQRFSGEVRQRALALCARLKVSFSGLTSAWAPFLVVAASLLKRGGRVAFVVPAEIGHAPYAAPVLDYFAEKFERVHVVAIRKKLFPNLSEDCWLLYAENFGGTTDEIQFTALEAFDWLPAPPPVSLSVTLGDWRKRWKCRLRPLLLSKATRDLYDHVAKRPNAKRFGDLATIGIGYVSGGNDFFHLRPSKAAELAVPHSLLQPTVRSSRYLSSGCVSAELVEQWRQADVPMLLLKIPKALTDIPKAVARYLDSDEGMQVRSGYKCRHRDPWYSVPDIHFPEFFLSYLSGRRVSLVQNSAGITCTNALHYVRLKKPNSALYISEAWQHPVTQLSCEIEGHPLGGGVLKLEPREASAVVLTKTRGLSEPDIFDGIATLRSWRHYAGDTQ